MYIHTYICALVAQMIKNVVKNPPAMQETWVLSLGWEDALEKGMATPWTEACQALLFMKFSRQEYWSG